MACLGKRPKDDTHLMCAHCPQLCQQLRFNLHCNNTASQDPQWLSVHYTSSNRYEHRTLQAHSANIIGNMYEQSEPESPLAFQHSKGHRWCTELTLDIIVGDPWPRTACAQATLLAARPPQSSHLASTSSASLLVRGSDLMRS